MSMGASQRIEFAGSGGHRLAARLDMPPVPVRAFALFAHCFTCSKDFFASQRISAELAKRGIAVLRFDFTGLGASGGEFANSNFSSNIEDIRRAAAHLAEQFGPVELLVGHSLGGAAVLAAAIDLPDVKAVVTIGAPADAEHVVASFQERVPTIEAQGEASVQLAGRHFTIRRQFLEDVRAHRLERAIAALHRPLLVLHAPMDEVVGLDNARRIFDAARHPKSFVSLDGADHLLTRREDAAFVADIVSGWCSRYIAVAPVPAGGPAPEGVRVRATGKGRFQQAVEAGPHRLLADEPERDGGLGSGPSPYDLLSAGLAACTAMTMRLYADRRGWRLPPFTVEVRHDRVHADDCESCIDGATGQVDRFTRTIAFDRELEGEARAKILEIAGKCPVHRTLESRSTVATTIETRADAGSG